MHSLLQYSQSSVRQLVRQLYVIVCWLSHNPHALEHGWSHQHVLPGTGFCLSTSWYHMTCCFCQGLEAQLAELQETYKALVTSHDEAKVRLMRARPKGSA